jgi:hypothetical protein
MYTIKYYKIYYELLINDLSPFRLNGEDPSYQTHECVKATSAIILVHLFHALSFFVFWVFYLRGWEKISFRTDNF